MYSILATEHCSAGREITAETTQPHWCSWLECGPWAGWGIRREQGCFVLLLLLLLLFWSSIPNMSVIIHWHCGQDLFMWLMAGGGAIGWAELLGIPDQLGSGLWLITSLLTHPHSSQCACCTDLPVLTWSQTFPPGQGWMTYFCLLCLRLSIFLLLIASKTFKRPQKVRIKRINREDSEPDVTTLNFQLPWKQRKSLVSSKARTESRSECYTPPPPSFVQFPSLCLSHLPLLGKAGNASSESGALQEAHRVWLRSEFSLVSTF